MTFVIKLSQSKRSRHVRHDLKTLDVDGTFEPTNFSLHPRSFMALLRGNQWFIVPE